MNYAKLANTEPGTQEFDEFDRHFKRQFIEMASTYLDASIFGDILTTLESKLSVANVRLTRLLHYYLFTDDFARLPNFALLNPDSVTETQILKIRALTDLASLYRHGASQEAVEIAEEVVKEAFPGLTINQVGYLLGCAWNHRRARLLKAELQKDEKMSLAKLAAFFTLDHGRGYAATEAGFFDDLTSYLKDGEGLKTELAHLQLLDRITKATDRVKIAACIHPVAFATALSELEDVFSDAKKELAATKRHWQISIGASRLRLTAAVDDMLAVSFLRLATLGKVSWREIAVRVSDISMTEDKARGLFDDFKKEPWHETLFKLSDTPTSRAGFQFFADGGGGMEALIGDAASIEDLIYPA